MKPRLFIDMDGTLAEFHPVKKMETLLEKGYFRNLKEIPEVVLAVKELLQEEAIEVYILSAVLKDNPYAAEEKRQWLKEKLPEISESRQIFCHCGANKKEFAHGVAGVGNDFLLDDYTPNLMKWGEGAIKLLNGINHTKGSWQGNRIRANKEPEALAKQLREIILYGKEIYEDRYSKDEDKENQTLLAWQKFEWNRNKAMIRAGYVWEEIQPYSMLKIEAGAEIKAEIIEEMEKCYDPEPQW